MRSPIVERNKFLYFYVLLLVEIEWDGTGWIKANEGQTGFYRVNYEQKQWDQLINQLERDHTVGKLDFVELFLFSYLLRIAYFYKAFVDTFCISPNPFKTQAYNSFLKTTSEQFRESNLQ